MLLISMTTGAWTLVSVPKLIQQDNNEFMLLAEKVVFRLSKISFRFHDSDISEPTTHFKFNSHLLHYLQVMNIDVAITVLFSLLEHFRTNSHHNTKLVLCSDVDLVVNMTSLLQQYWNTTCNN